MAAPDETDVEAQSTPDLPSLDVIRGELDLRLAEQERRSSAFDTRSALVVASGGALIGLTPDDPILVEVMAQGLSAAAAGVAVWALMPRVSAGIGPKALRNRYLTHPVDHTKLKLLDTRIHLYERDEGRLKSKVRRLRYAVGLLGGSVLLMLIGSIIGYVEDPKGKEKPRDHSSGQAGRAPSGSSFDPGCRAHRQR